LRPAARIAAKFPRVTVLYREHIKGYARSTREHYCIALDNLDLAFKAFTLEQIEPKHIKAYIRRRTKKGAAMFEKRVGSAFFNWAREEGHTKAANPFHGVKFSKAPGRMAYHQPIVAPAMKATHAMTYITRSYHCSGRKRDLLDREGVVEDPRRAGRRDDEVGERDERPHEGAEGFHLPAGAGLAKS
jgi:hypothetical protein